MSVHPYNFHGIGQVLSVFSPLALCIFFVSFHAGQKEELFLPLREMSRTMYQFPLTLVRAKG